MDSNKYIGAFKRSVLEKLPQPKEGEYALCTDEEVILVYQNGEWIKPTLKADGLKISLYDLNSSIMSQMEPIVEFSDIYQKINDFDNFHQNTYYMLYGKENSYFTLFTWDIANSNEKLAELVIECATSVGKVVSVDEIDDGQAIEVWVRDDETAHCLLFFPYDAGVVKYGD